MTVDVLEVEKRYHVLKGTSIPSMMDPFHYVGERKILDRYVDTAHGDYYKNGIFIRVRNKDSLDFKFNPDHLNQKIVTDHVACHEYNFTAPFSDTDDKIFIILQDVIGIHAPKARTFEGFMMENHLVPLLTIDKTRQTYQHGDYEIVLDTILGLDPILEIEYTGSEKSQNTILEDMDALMKGLPIVPLKSGSFEILLRQENPDLYYQGKYLLERDEEGK